MMQRANQNKLLGLKYMNMIWKNTTKILLYKYSIGVKTVFPSI
jgi:hypothetical protein